MKLAAKNLLIKSAVIGVCLMFFAGLGIAQTRRATRRRVVKTNKTPKSTAPTTGFDIRTGANDVSTQIKNISKFLFNLGGVAHDIETLDQEVSRRRASRNAAALNARNKQAVQTSIKNLRAGLAALEIGFRTKPALRNYLFQISGISDMAGLAEDQAADGQITEAGNTLLLVIEKLSNTLAALP